MKTARSLFAGLLALALLAPPARAQSADSTLTTVTPTSPASAKAVVQEERPDSPATRVVQGPTLDAATAGIRPSQPAATGLPASAQQQGAGFGRAETLMIVGGAAFVAGLIIGDDAGTIVMVSGAAIGLYGLYLYLQTH